MLESVWQAARHKGYLWPLRAIFWVISYPYGWVVQIRNRLYERGLLRTYHVGIPVISVGNLSVGGTGKTPFVAFLVKKLVGPVAVVSRGYRGSAEGGREPVIVSDGKGVKCSARVCGDEPYLLAHNLPGALVIVGKDRVAAAHLAERLGARVIVLDDGFQHRRLYRNLDIVLLEHVDDRLFPRGRMREPMAALKRAHFVCKADQKALVPIAVKGQLCLDVSELSRLRVGLFCGIGRPKSFVTTVQRLGAAVVETLELADHQPITRSRLEDFAHRCQQLGAGLLLCTQKDWVKLPEGAFSIPLSYLQVELEFIDQEAADRLDQLLSSLFSS